MKALFLISSIFYILGLKIGHSIDLFKGANTIYKITNTTNAVKNAAKSIQYNDAIKSATIKDSLQSANKTDVQKIKPDSHL